MTRDRPEDLFDVFEPWTERRKEGGSVPEPPSMRRPRKRIGPRIPAPTPPVSQPDAAEDPVGFLRAVGIPEVQGLGRRLKTAEHQMRVQDLLDLPDPALRVLFWPHPGPMNADDAPVWGTLEVTIGPGDADAGGALEVRAVYWPERDRSKSVSLRPVAVAELEVPWLRSRVLDFVEAMLARI